jgi:hypothetical protein
MGVNRTRTMLYFSDVDVNIKLFVWPDIGLRIKTPRHDEAIKPFLADQSNLDKAERTAEAK